MIETKEYYMLNNCVLLVSHLKNVINTVLLTNLKNNYNGKSKALKEKWLKTRNSGDFMKKTEDESKLEEDSDIW